MKIASRVENPSPALFSRGFDVDEVPEFVNVSHCKHRTACKDMLNCNVIQERILSLSLGYSRYRGLVQIIGALCCRIVNQSGWRRDVSRITKVLRDVELLVFQLLFFNRIGSCGPAESQ